MYATFPTPLGSHYRLPLKNSDKQLIFSRIFSSCSHLCISISDLQAIADFTYVNAASKKDTMQNLKNHLYSFISTNKLIVYLQDVGICGEVPEPVSIDDNGNVEGLYFLQNQRNPAQH